MSLSVIACFRKRFFSMGILLIWQLVLKPSMDERRELNSSSFPAPMWIATRSIERLREG